MSDFIEINPQRIEYLVKLFGLREDRFLSIISEKLTNQLTRKDIFTERIKRSHLERVDKLFAKGLSFYTDPTPAQRSPSTSIFFRKKEFNSPLDIGDRKIVSKMEDAIHFLTGLAKLSGMHSFTKRKFPTYKVADNPIQVANRVRSRLYPHRRSKGDRDFLKDLIDCFAKENILVHEFVEAWNLKYKAQIDGFFIAQNHIAIKRNQKALKREIFTLAHELGHYLLRQEELDQNNFDKQNPNHIERWCDNFAFHFLLDEETIGALHALGKNNLTFDNGEIATISQSKHISRLSLFTHLAHNHRISWGYYKKLKADIDEEYREKQRKEELAKKIEKQELGEGEEKPKRRGAQAILSPLEKDIYISAYFEGVVGEYEILKRLGQYARPGKESKKTKLEKIIYGDVPLAV